jgi:small subunit ribosomal protein S16
MAVTVRLMRLGKRGQPFYRIVAVDRRKKRNANYIENIGFYDPISRTESIRIDRAKLDYWLSRGAQVSEGLRKLLKRKV